MRIASKFGAGGSYGRNERHVTRMGVVACDRYGSPDAGRTVACDAAAAESISRAGEVLGLKPHMVGTGKLADGKPALVEVVAPCDIEVHRGKDGRLYGALKPTPAAS